MPESAPRPPLAPRPDPTTQLIQAVQQRDQPLTRRLVEVWVHRRGLDSLRAFCATTGVTPEDVAWVQQQMQVPWLAPATGFSPARVVDEALDDYARITAGPPVLPQVSAAPAVRREREQPSTARRPELEPALSAQEPAAPLAAVAAAVEQPVPAEAAPAPLTLAEQPEPLVAAADARPAIGGAEAERQTAEALPPADDALLESEAEEQSAQEPEPALEPELALEPEPVQEADPPTALPPSYGPPPEPLRQKAPRLARLFLVRARVLLRECLEEVMDGLTRSPEPQSFPASSAARPFAAPAASAASAGPADPFVAPEPPVAAPVPRPVKPGPRAVAPGSRAVAVQRLRPRPPLAVPQLPRAGRPAPAPADLADLRIWLPDPIEDLPRAC